MTYNFDDLPDRKSTDSVKWKYRELSKFMPDMPQPSDDEMELLPMWVADMDFRSPEAVIKALEARVAHGVFGYSMPPESLNQRVVEWLAKRHQWEVSPGEVSLVPGVVVSFNLAAHAVSEPGDGVLVQTPNYFPFYEVAKNVDMVQEEMELTWTPEGYEIDYEAFEAAITAKTRIFMLCNPHNPTGRVFRREELERMAEICLRHEVVICSDEIHSDLIFSDHKHIPIASLDPEIAKNTITLLAPSKTFNLAGLKASVAVIQDPDLQEKFNQAKQGLVGWVNMFGMLAMETAYGEGEGWLDALLVYLEANRDLAVDFVREELLGISMVNPEGTYLAWLDCREAGMEGKPGEFFVQNTGVVMNEGSAFGKGGEGFARLNFGCPRSMLVEALERMKDGVL